MGKIFGLAADVEKAIDRARSAQDPSPWPRYIAPVEARVAFSAVLPICLWIVHGFEIANWDMNPRIAVFAARFDQSNRVFWISRKPVGHSTTSRTGTNYDKVKFQFLSYILKIETLIPVFDLLCY